VHFPAGVRELGDGGVYHTLAGQPTDDSEMALSLARAILREGRYDAEKVLDAYRAWLTSRPVDVGQTTERGLLGMLTRLSTAPADPPPETPRPTAELCRDGELWRIRYRNSTAHLRDAKGLADLHTLLTRPGTDVHVLDLAGAAHNEPASGNILDPTARVAYRRRLIELDHDLAAARADHDIGRAQYLDNQRAALITELRKASGLAGRTRSLGASSSERARKTVTSRLREAIRRIQAVLPELGEHLDRSIITGTTCRYQPATPMTWKLTAMDK